MKTLSMVCPAFCYSKIIASVSFLSALIFCLHRLALHSREREICRCCFDLHSWSSSQGLWSPRANVHVIGVWLINTLCLDIFSVVNEWHNLHFCLLWMGSVSNHFIVLQDPAVALAKKGYHVLLEKPMAVSVCHKAPWLDAVLWGSLIWFKSTLKMHTRF